MKKPLSLLAGGLLLAGSLVACSSDSGGTGGGGGEDTLTVGVLLPLTGSLSALGNEMNNGYLIAQDLFNEAGGANGKKIVFETSDAPTPEDAVSIANRLSANPDVPVIMGSYSSGIAIPASEVANRNQTVYWETGAASPEVTSRGLDWVFRTNGNSGQDAYHDVNVRFFEELVAPTLGKDPSEIRIGVAHEDSSFGVSSVEAFQKMADENSWNIVTVQPYNATANDLSSVVQNMKSADVEMMYAVSYVSDGILLMKQSKELGFEPDLVWGFGAGFTTPDMAQAIGDDINGVVAMDGAPLYINDDLLLPEMTPKYSEFIAAYQERFGRDPLVHATIGYIGAMALFQEVLTKAEDPTSSESIREAAWNVDVPNGGTAAHYGIKFGEDGQNERAGFFFMQYVDQKMVTVFPREVAAAEFTPMR